MAKNDVVLIDSILNKKKADYSDLDGIGEIFEFFSMEQILKNYHISYDEINSGWVDGKDDGGVDGFFLFIDEKLPNVVNQDMDPVGNFGAGKTSVKSENLAVQEHVELPKPPLSKMTRICTLKSAHSIFVFFSDSVSTP